MDTRGMMGKEFQSWLGDRLCSLKFTDFVVPECVEHKAGVLVGREMSFPERGDLRQALRMSRV